VVQPVKNCFRSFAQAKGFWPTRRVLLGWTAKIRNSKPFGNLLLGKLTLRRAAAGGPSLVLSKNMFFDSLNHVVFSFHTIFPTKY
jgi:hypothetical protein